MFIRSDFVNLTFALCIFYIFVTHAGNEMFFRLLTLGIMISIGLDVLWLMVFTVDWERGVQNPEDGLRRLIILLSCFNLLIKLPLIVMFWRNAIEERKLAKEDDD